MKKLIFTSILTILLMNAFANVSVDPTEPLWKYLGLRLKYPNKAKVADLQGNSVVLFIVADGKIKDLKIETELGGDCDGEVVNKLLSYTEYKSMKAGKYALISRFKLERSTSPVKNDVVTVPKGFTPIKIVLVASAEVQAKVTNTKSGEVKEIVLSKDGSSLTFRGTKTKSNLDPLYILDEKTIDSVGMASLDPNSIESIKVFKGEKATDLYGKEAEHGVVVITSKNYVPNKKN